jgi:hypothetical protein
VGREVVEGRAMMVYTVTKPGGTRDQEFEAYTRLLENVRIDVANAPRVPEPGTERRWLYAWKKKAEAEAFAAELRRRTGDASWVVYDFEIDAEEHGPVAPLEVAAVPEEGGYLYYLTPASRERVVDAHRGTRFPPGITISVEQQHDLLRDRESGWWMEAARLLTGRSDEEIDALGGVRFVVGEHNVLFERIPAVVG